MSKLFDKLNLKDHREILVVNAPASFESELTALAGVTVFRDPGKVQTIRFALAFAKYGDACERCQLGFKRRGCIDHEDFAVVFEV